MGHAVFEVTIAWRHIKGLGTTGEPAQHFKQHFCGKCVECRVGAKRAWCVIVELSLTFLPVSALVETNGRGEGVHTLSRLLHENEIIKTY